MKQMFLAAVITMVMAVSSQASTLSFSPGSDSFLVGESFSMDVMISDLADQENLASFDFNVLFDDSILSFKSYELGSALGDTDFFEAFNMGDGDLGSGTINLGEVSLLSDFSSQPDSFLLTTLTFETISAGQAGFKFDIGVDQGFGDEDDNWITNVDITGTASINVSTVPEPATGGLFFLGLLGLAVVGRKRN